MKIHAIRSLQCQDHACNIPPNVLNVLWFLGKRCNFDCSYCSPHNHDAVSPFIDLVKCQNFVSRTHGWADQHNKKIKWSFTGGEPFLDPGFLPLLATIKSCASTEQINVVTNGSLPVDTYLHSQDFLAGLTFSLHLERPQQEIQNTLEKIIDLHSRQKSFVNVNLMFLPSTLDQVKQIRDQLGAAGVSSSVRRITPMHIEQQYLPYRQEGSGRKDVVLTDIEHQSRTRQEWKKINVARRTQALEDYYSPEEEQYLDQVAQESLWQNLGAWTDQGYRELNSNNLIAEKTNRFRDWICYGGVDDINIDFDGKIYRAFCQNGGPIGHINDDVAFGTQPTLCQLDWCICVSDIAIRKAHPDHVDLILGSGKQS